jgi:replication-associated recombination protein RarA
MNFAAKYAPKVLDDLVIESSDTFQRIREYADGERGSNLILYGPRGTGKSTAARVICETRCGDTNLISAYTGVDFAEATFDSILNSWQWQQLNGIAHPTVIIDEIDQIKPADQSRMSSFIEHYKFGSIIGTTNNPHRINGPLTDRFDQVELPVVSTDAWAKRASFIFTAEGVEHTPAFARAIVATNNGSIRDTMRAIEDYVIAKRNAELTV